jgi:hypothetical protein
MQVILYLIDKLNVDKSLGPDGTHLRVVKEFKGEIGELLAKMCKCSLWWDVAVPESAREGGMSPTSLWGLLIRETGWEARPTGQV